MNLISPPMVDSSKEINITEISLPLITVCLTDQTNFTRLEDLGYEGDLVRFYKGRTSSKISSNTSWGKHINMSFSEMLNQVYDVKELHKIRFSIKGGYDYRYVFLPSFGFCKEFVEYDPTKDILIYFKPSHELTKMRIVITNRDHRSHYSPDILSHLGNSINIGLNEHHYIDVDVKIRHTRPFQETKSNNYENCVAGKIKSEIENKLGCNPPWLSLNNQCNSTYEDIFLKKVPNFGKEYIEKLLTFENNEIERDCMDEDSVKTILQVNSRVFPGKFISKISNGRAYIRFNQKVAVKERVYNYSFFQYIIDVGSSLGLWLGLSMLGIYDIFTVGWNVIKNFNFKNTYFN